MAMNMSRMGPVHERHFFKITCLVEMNMDNLENGQREFVVPNISLSVPEY